MSIEKLFEKATRQKFRFASVRGQLTVEQLWDLPLMSKVNFDLDSVAIAVNSELKQVAEESFVTTKPNHVKTQLEESLELVKYIINVKLEEAAKATKEASIRVERERLMAILNQKENAAIESLSVEEIQARLAALGI